MYQKSKRVAKERFNLPKHFDLLCSVQTKSARVSKMVSSGDGIQKGTEFFRELDIAVEALEDKIISAQKIVIWRCQMPSRGMVAEVLRKIHNKIICRYKSRSQLTNP